jgi:hypothetical protein
VPLGRLQSVINETSPNAAIAEVHPTAARHLTERIAAIVIEITTGKPPPSRSDPRSRTKSSLVRPKNPCRSRPHGRRNPWTPRPKWLE